MQTRTVDLITDDAAIPLFDKAVAFLRGIGIAVHFRKLEGDCFLPGIHISGGEIIVDSAKLKYPGDILHEAGHIAVVPAAERLTLNADSIAGRQQNKAEEMMAIAWSYAACVYLNMNPDFVFHNEGYRGDGESFAKDFSEGRYFGVPVLKWVGMCNNPDEENGYPKMTRWLRE